MFFFGAQRDEDPKKLIARIEKRLQDSFGFEIPVLLFSQEEISAILTNNPFLEAAEEAGHRLYFVFVRLPRQIDGGIEASDAKWRCAKERLQRELSQREFPMEDWAFGPDCIYLQCNAGLWQGQNSITTLLRTLGN